VDNYKPEYDVPSSVMTEAAELSQTDVSTEELIDRLVIGHQKMEQRQVAVFALALISRGIAAGVEQTMSNVMTMRIVKVGKQGELDESWIDVGCNCPRCEDQRQLREQGKEKVN
jgi:hypothetical protein